MMVVVTYDVNTQNAYGRKRLRKIADICLNHGQRVQNSVFECQVDSSQLFILKRRLLDVINLEKDSLRIYQLGNHYQNKIDHYGTKSVEDLNSDVIII